MTNSERKELLTDAITLLRIPGIGRTRYHRLVRAFGSPAAVLEASISSLAAIQGISRSTASDIKSSADREKAREVASRIIQLNWEVLFFGDEEYPAPLKRIDDAPPILFRNGQPWSSTDSMMAIVGTRHPTESGRRFTRDLAAGLATEGIVVVSGMAEGIDSSAHRGALAGGGPTVAVWGSSLEIVFPAANEKLAREITANGAVYSEYLPGTHPEKATFPERNRIIAGLSEGTVVVEAGRKSGALITARYAVEQGRELFAVPGGPRAGMSEGTNNLIKSGARLLTSVEDVFEELPRLRGRVLSTRFSERPDLTETERSILTHLSVEPIQIDKLARAVGMATEELLQFLLTLELKGVVVEFSGKRFALTESYA